MRISINDPLISNRSITHGSLRLMRNHREEKKFSLANHQGRHETTQGGGEEIRDLINFQRRQSLRLSGECFIQYICSSVAEYGPGLSEEAEKVGRLSLV